MCQSSYLYNFLANSMMYDPCPDLKITVLKNYVIVYKPNNKTKQNKYDWSSIVY